MLYTETALLPLLKNKHGNAERRLILRWGLRDYQVNRLDVPFRTRLYTYLHMAVVIILASIPSIFLNAPVGIAASYWASSEAKKDLEASRVKLAARDVLLSKKIYFSLIAVPVLWLTYAVLLTVVAKWQVRTVVVFLLSCPLFSYLGIMGVGAGMVDLRDLRPAFLRLLPPFRKVVQTLPETRAQLQKDVRTAVRKYGPALGALYYDRNPGWESSVRGGLLAQSPASRRAEGECYLHTSPSSGSLLHQASSMASTSSSSSSASGVQSSSSDKMEKPQEKEDDYNFSSGMYVPMPLEHDRVKKDD